MSYLSFFLLGGVAWFRPVLGYALFMLLQTPLANVAVRFVHPLAGHVVLMVATAAILMRPSQKSNSGRTGRGEVCAMLLSLIVLVRQPELMEFSISINFVVRFLFTFVQWGPLLIAMNRLNDKEMAGLRLWMSLAGMVVGIWGVLVFLTGNDYLIQASIWADPEKADTIAGVLGGDVERLVRNRFIVMGLYTVVPAAYWYALRGALVQEKQHWLRNLAMYAGAGSMVVATGISVTRSGMLLMGIGTAIMGGSTLMTRGMGAAGRTRMLLIGVVGVCLLAVLAVRMDITSIVEGLAKRFATMTEGDVSILNRLDDSVAAWAYIEKNICLFGAPGPKPMDNYERVGDPALPLLMWITYGVLGLIFLASLFLQAFWKLTKCWLSRQRPLTPDQQLFRSMLTAWAMLYVYIWITGSYLHPPDVFFMVLFLSEVGRLYASCRAPARAQVRWATA